MKTEKDTQGGRWITTYHHFPLEDCYNEKEGSKEWLLKLVLNIYIHLSPQTNVSWNGQ